MSGIGISVRDELSPLLAKLRSAAQIEGLSLVIGRSLVNVTKAHLVALNTERHRYGRNYYAQAARATSSRVTPQGPVLTVAQTGMRQRYLGGPIRPRAPRRYLTIPAAPEAYGRRASDFVDLDFALVHDPETGALRPALVRRPSTAITYRRRRQKDGSVRLRVSAGEVREGKVMFWLVRGVKQAADPAVLPSGEVMVSTAIAAASSRILRVRARGGAL